MKTKFKIIIWIFIALGVFFIAVNLLIGMFLPRIIEQQIEQNLKLKSSVGKVSLSPPFTVTLEKLQIGDLASIKKLSLSPDLIGLLFGKIVIHGLNVVDPVISLEQSADGKLNLPVLEQKGKPPAVYLTGLRVQNGKIIFTDRKISPNGHQLIIDKLNIKVNKVTFPLTSLAAKFDLSAELLNSAGQVFGKILFAGQLDYLAGGMDAKLEVKDMDIVNFAPYYGDLISKRKITQAILNLNSTFKAKKNDLEIITDFNLAKIIYENPEELAQALDLNVMQDALDLFADAKGNLKLEFKIDTRLDKPELSAGQIRKIILKAAAKNLANQPPEELIEKVSNTINKYKGIGKELKEIFGK